MLLICVSEIGSINMYRMTVRNANLQQPLCLNVCMVVLWACHLLNIIATQYYDMYCTMDQISLIFRDLILLVKCFYIIQVRISKSLKPFLRFMLDSHQEKIKLFKLDL